jgi:PKD repeat protein
VEHESADGTSDVLVLEGYVGPPSSVLVNGLPPEDWSYDAGTGEVSVTPTQSGAPATLVIGAPAPVVDFTAGTLSGTAPLEVSFTDDTWGQVSTWSWDFGDGGTSMLPSPTYVFLDPGDYTVTLTASGPGGMGVEAKSEYVSVQHPAPTAEFDASPAAGAAPLEVSFSDLSTGTVTSWSWDFGDLATSTEESPVHTYDEPGDYTVTLTVSGPGGMDAETKTDYVSVLPPPPTAAFEGTPLSGAAPLQVSFSDLSSGDVTSWSWDFGDLGTSDQASPMHTYTEPGLYTVTLTVSGPGGMDAETKTDYVTLE